MLRFALQRLLSAVPTLLILTALVFGLLRVAPGGPLDEERALPPEVAAQVAAAYHLDEPLWQQFARYLGGVLQGDLGPSFQYPGRSVNELIAAGFPVSLQLGAAALALPQLAYVARLMRGSMVEVLQQNFIRTARAKGLPESTVLLRHALLPALIPVLSWLGPATAQILTGSIVVEQIFSIPGLGRHFVQGALNRDYTVVMGVVLFYGALIVLCNFLVDLLYGALDPRVRPR
jgi:ABC-type dipeptide/oligopeptide/nickel transport system permease component